MKIVSFFIFFFLILSVQSFAATLPYLLEENAPEVAKSTMRKWLPAIIEHQNKLRIQDGLAPLETNLEAIMNFAHNVKRTTGINVPAFDFSSWTMVDMRGNVGIINNFDDSHFLNHVYLYSEGSTPEIFSLAEFALSKTTSKSIPLFRYMNQTEYQLWMTQNLSLLRAHQPGGEEFWGFNELNTHVSPFKPWQGANLDSELACGFWVVDKSDLLKWSKNKKMVFGLTGQRMSQDYEIIILSSVWEELVAFPFKKCFIKKT